MAWDKGVGKQVRALLTFQLLLYQRARFPRIVTADETGQACTLFFAIRMHLAEEFDGVSGALDGVFFVQDHVVEIQASALQHYRDYAFAV